MTDFEISIPSKVVFGNGKLQSAGEAVKHLGSKAMIVCDKFSVDSGLCQKLESSLSQAGIKSVVFDGVIPNPTNITIDNAAAHANEQNVDFVIGLGGGSSMDTAKGVAVAATHGGKVWPCAMGEIEITDKTLPVVAITTTSGTGSQCTCFSVISNPETNQKPGMGSPYILPKVAIIDPELMLSVPTGLTVITGFDVFTHAVEAYTSTLANDTSDLFAKRALELLPVALPRVYNDGKDLEARGMMALADTYSGIAISHAVVSLGHVMAHVISGHYHDIAHGDALYSIYRAILDFNKTGLSEKHQFIANCLEPGNNDVVSAFDKFFAQFEFKNTFKSYKPDSETILKLAEDTFTYMKYATEFNPVQCGVSDAVKIFEDSIK